MQTLTAFAALLIAEMYGNGMSNVLPLCMTVTKGGSAATSGPTATCPVSIAHCVQPSEPSLQHRVSYSGARGGVQAVTVPLL